MRPFHNKPIKLEDCREHGPGTNAELFIVEGDSAAASVTVLRNQRFQATLPMQGKPLNAMRATSAKVQANDLYHRLAESLQLPLQDFGSKEKSTIDIPEDAAAVQSEYLANLRFEKVLMLFDPDADGIHIGALMLMFFYRWMRPLLDSGRIEMVRAPLFAISWSEPDSGRSSTTFAYSLAQSQSIQAELRRSGIDVIELRHFRGLGSIDQILLRDTCVHPDTRKTLVVSSQDAQAALSIFGGKPPQ
jgi:DNA gyrase subunit B